MTALSALLLALGALSDPTVDIDGNGYADRCEQRGAAMYHLQHAAVDIGLVADEQEADDAALEQAMVDCYAETAVDMALYLESTGFFGVTSFERALEVSHGCGTPTAWVERAGKGWIAVCADADGAPVSYRGAL